MGRMTKDDKILLVKEKNGTWSLPGGWVDINQSLKTNTEKEVKERTNFGGKKETTEASGEEPKKSKWGR